MRTCLLLLSFCFAGCVPDIYLIDRQTILELEASGQWPELEQKFKNQLAGSSPVSLEEAGPKVEQRKLFQMTHADQEPRPSTEP